MDDGLDCVVSRWTGVGRLARSKLMHEEEDSKHRSIWHMVVGYTGQFSLHAEYVQQSL